MNWICNLCLDYKVYLIEGDILSPCFYIGGVTMKKYLSILIVLLGIALSYFTYNNYNMGLFYRYNSYQDYIALIEDKNMIPLYVKIQDNNKEYMQEFIEQLIQFSENKYTFTFVYSEYDDTTEISCFSLYTQNKNITDDFKQRGASGIDFQSSQKQGYYTTDLDDKSAKGYIEILDNQIFYNYDRITRIVSLEDSIDQLVLKEEVAIDFFVEDINEFIQTFDEFLKETHLDEKVSYENIYGYYNGAQFKFLDQEDTKQIFSYVIYVGCVYIAFLLIYFTKKKKTILIQRLHGLSQMRIIYQEISPLLIIHYGLFVVIFFLCMYLLAQEKMFQELRLLQEIATIFAGMAVIMIVIALLVYLLVKMFISMKSLKSTSYSSKNVIYVMTIKIIVLSLLTAPIIEMGQECYNLGKNYYYLQEQYNMISKMSYIDGNMNDTRNNDVVFNYYSQRNGIYCDFETYAHNTLESLTTIYPEIDEDKLNEQALDFPVIYVNANYIEMMQQVIYKKDGTILDLKEYETDKLLVPSQHMSGRLENVLINGSHIQGEIETIEIKNTGTFVNYTLTEPYTLTNPVIYLVTQKNENCFMQNFYIPYSHNLADEIYDLTHETASLKLCQKFLDNDIRNMKDNLKKYSIIVILYIIIYASLLYQSVFWFIEEFKKLLMIEYIFGRSKKERYQELYVFNSVVYIVPLIINAFFKAIPVLSLIKLYVISLIIEMLIMYLIIRKLEKTNVGIILKGDHQL